MDSPPYAAVSKEMVRRIRLSNVEIRVLFRGRDGGYGGVNHRGAVSFFRV